MLSIWRQTVFLYGMEGFLMKRKLSILSIMYAPDGGSGAGGGTTGSSAGGGTTGSGEGNDPEGSSGGNGTGSGEGNDPEGDKGQKDKNKPSDFERLLQARLDKAMAEERKKSSALQKELEKMKREKMTADELKKYDDEQKQNALDERERAITEKENRYYAIGAIKKAGLDDGSETALRLVDLVMGADSEEIDKKVAALNELVNKIVDSKVNEKFKGLGRTPNGGGNAGGNGGGEDKNTLAERLGRQRAAQSKKSSDILKHYI